VRREPLAPSPTSLLDGTLRDVAELCRPPSCEPLIVVLPIDLQVSPDEWRKYDLEPHDISNVQALTDQILRSAVRYGVRAVDAMASLRASEPGVFLKGDVHMAPKGHVAVAGAVAAALAKPAPLPQATGAFPDGRSRVPSPEELASTAATVVRGSEKSGCGAVQVDEWLRVRCSRGPRNVPRSIDVIKGSGDAFINVSADGMSIVAPVLADAPLIVDLVWADRTQRLHAKREADGAIVGVLESPKHKTTAAAQVSREQEALCACSQVVASGSDCSAVYGSTRPECFATYPMQQADADTCRRLLDCAQGSPSSPPSCPEGYTVAGGTRQCFRQCSEAVACDSGTCVPWPDTQVCMGQH
jgi:hypothetical protein